MIHWADTPHAAWALFFVAVAESSFFPIPPDALLIPMAIAAHKRSFRYGALCTFGSVVGGVLGYIIGVMFMDHIGRPIIEFYGVYERYYQIQDLYRRYDAWAVMIAGFTPIPYKVFTIAAGAFKINFAVFMLASIMGRGGRFFLVSGLIYVFGPSIEHFVGRYLNWIVVVVTVILVAGFVFLSYVF